MTFHLLAIGLWCLLFRKISRWIWICILTGMTLVVLHCAGYFVDSLALSQMTALSNSALALFAVIATRHSIKKRELEQKTSVAAELARILTDYRLEVDYYERKARELGFSVYKNK